MGAGQPGTSDVTVPVILGSDAKNSPAAQTDASCLSAAYEVSCSRQQGAGAGQLFQACGTASSAAGSGLALAGLAALPAAMVTFRPILAKSVSAQPLARALLDSLRGIGPAHFQVKCYLQSGMRACVRPAMGQWQLPGRYAAPPHLFHMWLRLLCATAAGRAAVHGSGAEPCAAGG